MAKIKEVFESIQGEGVYVGEKQIFVRFSKCNLNCTFCDTNFRENLFELNEDELYEKIKDYDAASISLTGGEPLLHAGFIKNFLLKYKNKLNKKIHLETNGTLYNELNEVVDLVDVIAMDIKIKSATKEENRFLDNDRFLQNSRGKAFIKVVFTKNIQEGEIEHILYLAKKYKTLLILQPKTPIDIKTPFLEIYNRFYREYKNVKLIPQTHTFLQVR